MIKPVRWALGETTFVAISKPWDGDISYKGTSVEIEQDGNVIWFYEPNGPHFSDLIKVLLTAGQALGYDKIDLTDFGYTFTPDI